MLRKVAIFCAVFGLSMTAFAQSSSDSAQVIHVGRKTAGACMTGMSEVLIIQPPTAGGAMLYDGCVSAKELGWIQSGKYN